MKKLTDSKNNSLQHREFVFDTTGRGVFDLFTDLVEGQGERPFIISTVDPITYKQAKIIAENISRAICDNGIERGEMIGVLTDRSAWLPVTFLATMRAGCVYVPMPADQPPQRLVSIVKQTKLRAVIALDQLSVPELVCEAMQENAVEYGVSQGLILRPEDLCVPENANSLTRQPIRGEETIAVLFTSGSTGQPKGVCLKVDSCLNMALGHVKIHDITPQDRILLSTSPGFILGFRELCLPLVSGAAYVPASRSLLDEPALLVEMMSSFRVSIALLTPSYLRLLNHALPDGLRCILTAGERPNVDDAIFYGKLIEYWNLHGATEVCGTICMHRVSGDSPTPLPSGVPFLNTGVVLLDKAGQDVAADEVGEIFVVGAGLSPGYLNQPELTAQAFVQTRYGRAYRTNDLGRWNESGELVSLGRADDMVKVSGQSVSLSEVERTLQRHPSVKRASVLRLGQLLVGVVEVPTDLAAESVDWRAFLALTLAGYMIPARILQITKMPIASAGKIDRSAIIRMLEDDLANRPEQKPEGALECDIAQAWEDILDFRPVMRDDNFFAVGGTSLLSISVSQRLQQTGYPVSAQMVLACLTVADLAQKIQSRSLSSDSELNPDVINQLTLGQKDFWVADHLEFAAAASHVVRVLRIQGTVPDSSAWVTAWHQLIARHPALRTSFERSEPDALTWVITEPETMSTIAKFQIDGGLRLEDALLLVNRFAIERFDLARAPLIRAGLMGLTDQRGEFLFWFVAHHAVVDGTSAKIIQDDMLALLLKRNMPVTGNGIALASAAEQAYLLSERFVQDSKFWSEKITEFARFDSDVLANRLGNRQRPKSSRAIATPIYIEYLDEQTVNVLSRFAQERKAGVHAVLMAILAAEIRRRSVRTEIIIGTGLLLRPIGGENAVGHFVNIVPIGLKAPSESFAVDVDEAQSALTEVVSHGEYPSSRLRDQFQQAKSNAGNESTAPLVEVALTANLGQLSQFEGSTLSFKPLEGLQEQAYIAAGLDLAFTHQPAGADGRALALSLVWNPDVISESEAADWISSFAQWARWLAADIVRSKSVLPSLLPSEAARLNTFECGPVNQRPDARLDELVYAHAQRDRHSIAIVQEDRSISYGELDVWAQQIAAGLQGAGIKSGDRVGVLTDVSGQLIATILGIWKTGAVYLPIVSDTPVERAAFMLHDMAAAALLVLDNVDVPVSLVSQIRVLNVSEFTDGSAYVAVEGSSADLAYVIYTSGTTGQPKGVALSHEGMINVGFGTLEPAGVHPDDRVAFVATPGFDASLWEMAMGLTNGLALVPVERSLRDDPWALKRYYQRKGVTIAFHAPSYLRVSIEQPFEGLRILLIGGEPPTKEDLSQHIRQGLAVWTAYGPTEACIIVSLARVTEGVGYAYPIPAGRTLSNATISIRQTDGRQLPPGVVGEVWLGGVGLASGYMNREQLSATVFIETEEGRFYRSGDLGRWSEQGLLELSGRIDDQVKLHGQRLEPAEIERALCEHPSIREAVVMLTSSPEETKVLRAFAVAELSSRLPAEDDWRIFLADRLPAFMVPSSLIELDRIPLLQSGKIDRSALRLLAEKNALSDSAARAKFESPIGEVESRIAMLWSEMFNVPVGRRDNFFALGGNSLLAVSMAHSLSVSLGIPVAARSLFSAPELMAFALQLNKSYGQAVKFSPLKQVSLASEGQREFWLAQQTGLDTRSFVIPMHRVISGAVPPANRWQEAWHELVMRHDALRAWFEEDDLGQLHQRVKATVDVHVEFERASDLAAANRLAREHQSAPMAMDCSPLWRVGLIAIEQTGEHLFWLALHHSVGDGHSVGLLIRELSSLLQGERLPALPANLSMMLAHEHAYLASAACDSDAQYWQAQLSGLPSEAFDDWPLDQARELEKTGMHRFQTIADITVAEGLRGLAREHQASLHAVMLSILAHEVGRRTAREKLVIGMPSTIRDSVEQAQIVGYGVNMLPVVLKGELNQSFAHRLRATQQQVAQGLAHGIYPFARIYQAFWKAFPSRRNPLRFPLFDFAVTENPPSAPDSGSLQMARVAEQESMASITYEHTESSPMQDMVLVHELMPDGRLLMQLQVNSAIYNMDTARAWSESIFNWARWLGEDVSRAQAALPPLLPAEAARLAEFERGPVVERPDVRLDELVHKHAQRIPDNVAIVLEDRSISYCALDTWAQDIAAGLQHAGIKPGDRVGVLTGRSGSLPAVLLGVWKAGAVYVPLACDLPEQRLVFIAQDAGLKCLCVLDGCTVPEGLQNLLLTVLRPENFKEHTASFKTPPRTASVAQDLAYILYTSGTTGYPKGIMVGHGSYINLLLGAGETLDITERDCSVMLASVSFDVSLSDIGIPLAHGASLCHVSDEDIYSPTRFLNLLKLRNVSIADMTPSYLRLLNGAELPGLRAIVTGGEGPIPMDVSHYASRLSYFNAYGPTEATITSTMQRLDENGSITAGRPLANTSVSVRNAGGERLAPGMTGEICLGGVGLAIGYVNRPDQQTSFVDSPEGRYYRTGDAGRWSDQGLIEVCGRLDSQIKFNGIRIESEEIESNLERHPDVQRAIVVLDEKIDSTKIGLSAFVVLRSGHQISRVEDLLAFLALSLPSYMIPTNLNIITEVPLTSAGKVDRKKLQLNARPKIVEITHALQSDLERCIAQVWSDVLDCSIVSREHDFFGLGGHSLLAIDASHRLEKLLGVSISARELFADSSLSGFAARVARLQGSARVVADTTDLAISSQRDFWVAEQAGFETRGFNIGLTLEVGGMIPDDASWQAAWLALVDRHESLRTSFSEDSVGMLRRCVASSVNAVLEINSAEDQQHAISFFRALHLGAFSMSQPGLWRAGLVRINGASSAVNGASSAVFGLVLHHSIADGISLSVLVQELTELLHGQTLDPIARSFSQSAHRQLMYEKSSDFNADKEYWHQITTDILASGEDSVLPFDEWQLDMPRTYGSNSESSSGCHVIRMSFGPDTSGRLFKSIHGNNASLHAFLLTVLGFEISRRTGRNVFMLGTAASIREGVEDARIVGNYVNMIPLVWKTETGEIFESALRRMQKVLATSLYHSRFSSAQLVQDLRAQISEPLHPARYPLFDFAVSENPASVSAQQDHIFFTSASKPEGADLEYQFLESGPMQDMVLTYERQVDGGILIRFLVNASIYKEQTAKAWGRAIASHISLLSEHPVSHTQVLPFLLSDERIKLEQFQNGPVIQIPESRLDLMFERWAKLDPGRAAIILDNQIISYGTVDQRANAIAHAILAQGATSGHMVGVLTNRSVWLPESVLAIWKAGCGFVPLMQDLPAARLSLMIRDAGVRILIVLDQIALPAELQQLGLEVLRPEQLDQKWFDRHCAKPDVLRCTEADKEVSHLIYTSGSTGVPKGVLLQHKGLINAGVGLADRLSIAATDRMLLVSSPAFDGWIGDLAAAWAAGAGLVPVNTEEMNDTNQMLAKFDRLGITVAVMSPSYLRMFNGEGLTTVRTLMTVGEPPILADVASYSERLSYFNGYGPSEYTTATAIGRLSSGQAVNVGRPIANTRVKILDQKRLPVVPGATGEIWISGSGLSLGYLGQEDLTAQKFALIDDVVSYRTGDLGRWTDTGLLEFQGRMDTQIKIRGQRVELEEIEHALSRYPGVIRAIVALKKTAKLQQLWAFVVMQTDGSAPSPSQIRDFLIHSLPSYMVPVAAVRVQNIPVGLSGKVDRQALLSLTDSTDESLSISQGGEDGHDVDSFAPLPVQSEKERRIATLWSKVLGVTVSSRDDNFFALGGDSLRVIELMTQMRKEFVCKANDLYENPEFWKFASVCKPSTNQLIKQISISRERWKAFTQEREVFETQRSTALSEQNISYQERNRRETPSKFSERCNYRHFILTGSTGFLGSSVLKRLLTDRSGKVTVLIRANSDQIASQRLESVLSHYFGLNAARKLVDHPRLECIAADLTIPGFGLHATRYAQLVSTVDAVVHCAANTRHYGHYDDFEKSNVDVTRNLLDFAASRTNHTADFHYVSTLSVLSHSVTDGFVLRTEYDEPPQLGDENYYVRSKQAAEKLVIAYRDRISNASIYRTGNLVAAADAHSLQIDLGDNAFFRLLVALMKIGVVSDDFHVSPCGVDETALAISLLMDTANIKNAIHHLQPGAERTLSAFMTDETTVASEMQITDFSGLLDALEQAAVKPELEDALMILMESFGLMNDYFAQERGRRLDISTARTEFWLREMGFQWSEKVTSGQRKMLAYALSQRNPILS